MGCSGVEEGDVGFVLLAELVRGVYTLYMTVHLVISLPKVTYMHRICMVLVDPIGLL